MKRGVKKREPIKTESYIPIDGKRYKVSDLNEEQKQYIGACIKIKLLNAQFQGQATFYADLPPAEEVFADLQKKKG